MYQILYYSGSGLSILLFILLIVLFFKFNIPDIIGNLTGYSEKKLIKSKKIKSIRPSKIKIGKANNQNMQPTAPLEGESETVPLMSENYDTNLEYFNILQEITFIHTGETIV